MPESPQAVFRARLRALRRAAGLSQEQLSERAGLNYKHFQEIERGGKEEIRFSTLVRIAKALGIPLYQLFTPDDPSSVIAEAEGQYGDSPPSKE